MTVYNSCVLIYRQLRNLRKIEAIGMLCYVNDKRAIYQNWYLIVISARDGTGKESGDGP
jgi:hypothetical protein